MAKTPLPYIVVALSLLLGAYALVECIKALKSARGRNLRLFGHAEDRSPEEVNAGIAFLLLYTASVYSFFIALITVLTVSGVSSEVFSVLEVIPYFGAFFPVLFLSVREKRR